MHPDNLNAIKENFALFLVGWLGGPQLYKQKHGTAVNLTGVHELYDIGNPERDAWLACMEKALSAVIKDEKVKAELMQRFAAPAEKIRSHCQNSFHRSFSTRE